MELSKALQGKESIHDWIRLFNAKSEEDLEMIKVKNTGIREAIGAIKEMSLRKNLRYLYEEHMKNIRDRRAEDAYIRDEARAEGRAEAVLEILSELGDVPQELSDRIRAEKDIVVLNNWLRAAAKAEDIEQFREECEI